MKIAKVKNIALRENWEIIVTISAKDSIYIEEPTDDLGYKRFVNSAPLVEGINILLEHGHHAIKAMKGNNDFTDLIAENKRLKSLLLKIASFENGNKIELDGLHYQKAINENSFYTAISTETK